MDPIAIQAAIDAIQAGIAGGSVLQSMRFADQEFVFRSMDDMLRALAYFQGLLVVSEGSSGYRLAATSKGA
jgi:hypothetical protein